MNKTAIALVTALLLTSITNSFAQQKAQFITQLKKTATPAQLHRIVTKTSWFAPRMPGVYIPAGTSRYAIENRISTLANQAGLYFGETETKVLARTPELLRQFETVIERHIFEGRPLPKEKSVKVLQANQEKFAQARAKGEYENAWKEFIERKYNPFRNEKVYLNLRLNNAATDVYNFYVKHIGMKSALRVRAEDYPAFEAVVCEIPVDGFNIIGYAESTKVFPDEFVVIHSLYDGKNTIISRDTLEKAYRVIK